MLCGYQRQYIKKNYYCTITIIFVFNDLNTNYAGASTSNEHNTLTYVNETDDNISQARNAVLKDKGNH